MTDSNKLVRISPRHLCLGMFVVLPVKWQNHPFLRSTFLIRSETEIEQLLSLELDSITVDLSRSSLAADTAIPHIDELAHFSHDESGSFASQEDAPPWNPDNLIPDALHDALNNSKLLPEQRADAIFEHSREMMRRLLEDTTPENIQTGKQAIGQIADLILKDSLTSSAMLRISSHDFYTYTHSVNVGLKAIILTKELFRHSDAHNIHELAAGFFLHDLGKVNVRAEVINKPGRLTDAEMKHMRIHPYQGYKLLDAADALSEECRYIIMQHHERIDGNGYPRRLKGDEIHLYGRICCIADVFDALTAQRSYKKALTTFEALKLMKEEMLQHFDKQLFRAFVALYS